jgi:hypothetical protein
VPIFGGNHISPWSDAGKDNPENEIAKCRCQGTDQFNKGGCKFSAYHGNYIDDQISAKYLPINRYSNSADLRQRKRMIPNPTNVAAAFKCNRIKMLGPPSTVQIDQHIPSKNSGG